MRDLLTHQGGLGDMRERLGRIAEQRFPEQLVVASPDLNCQSAIGVRNSRRLDEARNRLWCGGVISAYRPASTRITVETPTPSC